MKLKIDMKRKSYLYPSPVLVVGTMDGERPNWSVIAYHGILDSSTIVLTIEAAHLTTELIARNRCFTVNIPGADDVERVEFIGTHSGRSHDKSDRYEYSLAAPLLPVADEYRMSYLCDVQEITEVGGKCRVTASVRELYADSALLQDGKIDLRALDPLLFDWGGYYAVGERLGQPFGSKTGK